MFNFKTLKLDRREDPKNTNSFVGIRKNENNEMEFRLPQGFDNFPDNDFTATKNLFFKMYRTFKKFEQDNKSLQLDERATGKDNIEAGGNGYQFKDKEDNEVVLYSKISVIENLLEAYHDLALDVIERRSGRNEEVDYSKIDKYLHKATYLEDDVIYIDEMELPRYFLQYQSATLIDLFCFILHELENELEQESDERVKELAHCFKNQYLTYDQSLFDEETFDTTITTLKDSLDTIDKVTAYKDEDYWQLYEAIESFLYGELDMKNTHEDGIFWGISNFYQIWEDMCNTYAFATFDDILYADTNIVFKGENVANYFFGRHKIFKKENFDNPFFIAFRGDKRWIRPDFIRFNASLLFRDIVNINIRKTYGQYIDFTINCRNIDKKGFRRFCSHIKKSIGANNLPSRSIKNNEFKNYPQNELEKILDYEIYKSSGNTLKILDWKYMGAFSFYTQSKKLKTDISKQLCYELSIKKFQPKIESQFVIPFFYTLQEEHKLEEDIGDFISEKLLYSSLIDNKIGIANLV